MLARRSPHPATPLCCRLWAGPHRPWRAASPQASGDTCHSLLDPILREAAGSLDGCHAAVMLTTILVEPGRALALALPSVQLALYASAVPALREDVSCTFSTSEASCHCTLQAPAHHAHTSVRDSPWSLWLTGSAQGLQTLNPTRACTGPCSECHTFQVCVRVSLLLQDPLRSPLNHSAVADPGKRKVTWVGKSRGAETGG